jgi:hypothetical protein
MIKLRLMKIFIAIHLFRTAKISKKMNKVKWIVRMILEMKNLKIKSKTKNLETSIKICNKIYRLEDLLL